MLRTGTCPKLAPRFCGPFKILDRVGLASYQLDFRSHIKVQNVFHVSLLKKSAHDNSHVIGWNLIQVEPKEMSFL